MSMQTKKTKDIVFKNKEVLGAYLSHFYIFIQEFKWDTVDEFYKIIESFIENYPNVDKK